MKCKKQYICENLFILKECVSREYCDNIYVCLYADLLKTTPMHNRSHHAFVSIGSVDPAEI